MSVLVKSTVKVDLTTHPVGVPAVSRFFTMANATMNSGKFRKWMP